MRSNERQISYALQWEVLCRSLHVSAASHKQRLTLIQVMVRKRNTTNTITTLIPNQACGSDDEDELSKFCQENETETGEQETTHTLFEWGKGDTGTTDLFDYLCDLDIEKDWTTDHLHGMNESDLFFDERVRHLVLTETNVYKTLTVPVTECDLQAFIAVLLLASYIRAPRYRMFWKRMRTRGTSQRVRR